LCKFTRKISNVENLHDLNVFFYTSSKKSTFKAGNKAQIHTIFFNRVCKQMEEWSMENFLVTPYEMVNGFNKSKKGLISFCDADTTVEKQNKCR
jgi:hypothetical protein